MFLETLRSYSKKWFFKLLLILISFCFVGFGITDLIMRTIYDKPLAKVGGTAVRPEEFNHAYIQETNRIMQMTQAKLDPAMLQQMGLHKIVLDKIVNEKALVQLYAQLNLMASDQLIKEVIESIPTFQVNGVYSSQRLKDILDSQKISDYTFFAEIRQMIFTQQLAETLAESIEMPRAYIDILMQALSEKNSFHVAKIALKSVPLKEKTTTENLKLYYNKHKDTYKEPEYRTIEYVLFDADKLSKKIKVTDTEMRDRYEQSRLDFTSTENRLAVKLSLTSYADAEKALEMLKKGESIKKVSGHIQGAKFEDIGLIEKDTLNEKASAAIFTTPVGSYSSIVQNGALYTIYQVTKINPPFTKAFDEVKDVIEETIQKEKYAESFQETRNTFEDALASGAELSKVALQFKVVAETTSPVDKMGLTATGEDSNFKKLPETVRIAIVDAAFQQNNTTDCQFIDVSSAYSAAVRIHTITPSRIPALDEIKEKVKDQYERAERRTTALHKAADIAKKAKTVAEFKAQASAEGFHAAHTLSMSRLDLEGKEFADSAQGTFFRSLPKQVFKTLFSTPVGECIVTDTETDEVVVLFHDKDEAHAIKKDMRDNIVKNINSLAAKDTTAFLIASARQRLKVQINAEIMKQLSQATVDGD